MNLLTRRLGNSPMLARVLPLAVFLALTGLQEWLGGPWRFWFYLAKTLVGAWMVWSVRELVTEMRWAFSWPAVAVGVAIFGLWVGLDGLYPRIYKAGLAWNPHHQFGAGSALAWGFALTRLAGSTLVVPPLEEVFYRSFLYRYLARQDFLAVPLGAFAWLPFLATSAIFGLGHHQWLPGIICGLAFQGLVCWKKRLGDALTAHATTNFLLGWWVIGKDAWNFW